LSFGARCLRTSQLLIGSDQLVAATGLALGVPVGKSRRSGNRANRLSKKKPGSASVVATLKATAQANAVPLRRITLSTATAAWLRTFKRAATSPWADKAPVRQELFGVERLEQHAESLARAQKVSLSAPRVAPLQQRLSDNADVLLSAYRASAAEFEGGHGVVPAAEWLLDNYHLVEAQIREVRDDLPVGYYRQLPKLDNGPFAGYPRVFGLAWAFVAHTDSHVDPEILKRFLRAYQRIQPLTLGELWAVAITLRIVLIENLRRLGDQITEGHAARAAADALADQWLAPPESVDLTRGLTMPDSAQPLSERFAAQLAKRLRGHDPTTTPAHGWLEMRLLKQESNIELVVQHAQARQGASNVSVRNVITSMRLMSDIDWADLIEAVSLVDAGLRVYPPFADMDFKTRNQYRTAVEELARGSKLSELEIAARAVALGERASGTRERDPGFYLISQGRRTLERQIDFRAPLWLKLNRAKLALGIGGYVSVLTLITFGVLGFATWALAIEGLSFGWLLAVVLLGWLPASEVASALVNRSITRSFGPQTLPGLELRHGIPSELRTLVAVPTLLSSEADLREQIERLEVHFLAGADGDLSFALLADGVDATQMEIPADAVLLTIAQAAIDALNQRHPPGPAGPRFLLLYRRRLFNAQQEKWMGWERKRGKLHELNRLLRGATDTSFVAVQGREIVVPKLVRYVITLDADTRLPREAARRLIGKMAHPLNQPVFNTLDRRIKAGYAILQPRVTPSLPTGADGSLYQRIFSGPGGIDPYAAAASDAYQDLFGEGSFTGKGIYDVDAFEAAMHGRVPENALLSHDLFEGIFARAGLSSDVELIEEFPARYDVVGKRQHRWTRGDWQLLPWIFGRPVGTHSVPLIGRWKMLDNLRRSLVAPGTLLAFALCWLMPLRQAVEGSLLVFAALAIPAFLPSLFAVLPARRGIRLSNHFGTLAEDLKIALTQALLSLAFLPDQAWRMFDAIARTCVRLLITRRHLLEWTTAAQSMASPRLDLVGFYLKMAPGTLLAAALALLALFLAPGNWLLISVMLLLWLLAPALAMLASRPPKPARQHALSDADRFTLRLIARRTWRYFEEKVSAEDSHLPPDNFQEDPQPVLAHRTSPTNIGLYLLSAMAARDFGWAGFRQTVERLEATLASMQRMPRYRGHFLNWYDTRDLRALEPQYVSAVDSGNFAGHLIALANACEEPSVCNADPREGLRDLTALASLELTAKDAAIADILALINAKLDEQLSVDALLQALLGLSQQANAALIAQAPNVDLRYWIAQIDELVAAHQRDRQATDDPTLNRRFSAIAVQARAFALGMDFAFLVDPERKLLSIGYALADNRLDPSCYDLLASEARLASLFAIAKDDVETKHWFRLGRTATPIGNTSALISWSGSMFEYLMPSLVMRAAEGSLLAQTNHAVVKRQQEYGASLGIPWGVSESAYSARDIEFTYQYSNFGVPGLGLKRGLIDNVVIAPYATALAAMIDAGESLKNFARLSALGAYGRYGFYDAIDFTRSRLPEGTPFTLVRNFMAHHQGMTILAIANTLNQGIMRARFHREPMIQACELLLQERMPRNVAIAHPRAEEASAVSQASTNNAMFRCLSAPHGGAPVTHLLSNGRYALMLTDAGGGYSRWRDIAITRWGEDPTCDALGSALFVRDTHSGVHRSATAQPLGVIDAPCEVVFAEDHAAFIRRDGGLTTTLEVLVSGDVDGEVRRLSITNAGRRANTLQLTSYAELVLTYPATDSAHPAFAKLFVVTEFLAEFGALIATRRPRGPQDAQVWAAHFAVVEGVTQGALRYETDRAQFLGRGRSIKNAQAFDGRALSNTVGTVLDPIFSLRMQVRVESGQVARVAFWTLVAPSRALLLDLIDQHHDRSAFDRARTLAWTQAQVQLRYLDVDAEQAAEFQQLAAPIIYADPRFKSRPEAIVRGAAPQSHLWPLSISGDLPIVLLTIDDLEDLAQVRQLLRAHEYWRMKGLAVDLVILNERAASYVQDLQIAIDTAVRSSQSRPQLGDGLAHGRVFALRAELLVPGCVALLLAVARVVLHARRGPLNRQLQRLLVEGPQAARPRQKTPVPPMQQALAQHALDLEFFNGLGGFTNDAREYVTVLNGGHCTPAPWLNVIANQAFGFQVSADGAGFSWAANSRENQLTPWSNDPVVDPCGEAIYVCDLDSHELFSPTAQPIRDHGSYTCRHGFGYSVFSHEAHGIALELTQFVALSDPLKISRLTLRNLSARPRRLSVTAYCEWTLGVSRNTRSPLIISERDSATGALHVRNRWSLTSSERVAFFDLRGQQSAFTCDRLEFIGRHGALDAPAALLGPNPLSGRVGAGLDPCAALQQVIELKAHESREVVVLLGQAASTEQARELIERYRQIDLEGVLGAVTAHWQRTLGALQVKTPDRALDILVNGWLLYQTIVCRVWARAAFYQASGAYGFRDQLQDGMALSFADPAETRRHLLRAAARQFVEGDVQHWWLPESGNGVRTHFSDDRVWLAFATISYVESSGDSGVLQEIVPFLEGPALAVGAHDAFFQPSISDESASLLAHCARGLEQAIALTGVHGLPLMGGGDWNDGMNRVGADGRGESVWLGWFLLRTLNSFVPYLQASEPEQALRFGAYAAALREALERHAWDGAWYRRATFDDGTWLGSSASDECRIDSIAQSWAVLSGGAERTRAETAMASMAAHLIRPDNDLALLFTPPFEHTERDPGYIKGYPPGLRENGGQYSHAAMWAVLAYTELGHGDAAGALLARLNPINHARDQLSVQRYKVEPYVVAADVYSVAPHSGRGGWTWYTGAAGWMYQASVHGLLGIRREGAWLRMDPCIPASWPGFSATIEVQGTQIALEVDNPLKRQRGIAQATLNGKPIEVVDGAVKIALDSGSHQLKISLS